MGKGVLAVSVSPPILLRTGTPVAVSTLSVTLSVDELPSAKLNTPDDVRMHDLVEVFTSQGSAGIFRVTDRTEAYGETVDVLLKGALDTLSDDVYVGTTQISGTVATVLGLILGQQSTVRWQLGTCAATGNIKLDTEYTDLLSMMEAAKSAVMGRWRWVCDYTTTPWTVSLAAMDDTVAAEFRIGRNVSSATIDMSDAEMCTRLYMTVSTANSSTLHVYDNAQAQAEWGVICRTADVKADDVDDPDAYGAAILAERAQPIAFITIDGEDLHELTGDDFDKIALGSQCRVVLDGYAGAFTETVTKVSWPDALGEPERISVSLANNLKPFTEQLNLIKRSGSGTAKKVEEQERELIRHRTDIVKTDERLLLWATEEEWDEIAEEYVETGKSQFEITSAKISSKVSVGGVSHELAVECDNVSITAVGTEAHLIVDGMITAEALETMDITVASLHADYVSVGSGGVVLDDTGNSVTASSFYMNSYDGDLVDSIKAVQVVPVSGTNSYKLQFQTFSGGSAWTDAGTFERGSSGSVTLSGAWSADDYTVTPSPLIGTPITESFTFTASPNTNTPTSVTHFTSAHKAAVNITSTRHSGSTPWKQILIDATEVYSDGVTDGASFDLTDVGLTAGTMGTPATVGNYWYANVDITKSCTGMVSDTDTVSVNVQPAVNVGVQAGFDMCHGTISLTPNAETTISPGGSVTVKAMANATPSSTSASEVASVVIKASSGYTYSATLTRHVNGAVSTGYADMWFYRKNSGGSYVPIFQVSVGNSVFSSTKSIGSSKTVHYN